MSASEKKVKTKRKISKSTVILVITLLVGFSVMLYPSFSNWFNNRNMSKAVAGYQRAVSGMTDEEYEEIIGRAHEYNRELAGISDPFRNYDEVPDYDKILDITGTGIMGYITIPQIRVELPIYHGTSKEVLNVAVGHFQGSSLPVGGETTHAVISAHRGLPSAKLFSDLDKLTEGDDFTITVLKDTYTYRVDQILIVEPDQTEALQLMKGKDYVTLTTCTPYGINSHRLLVRAHRVSNAEKEAEFKITADATQIDSMQVIPFVAAPLLLILICIWVLGGKRRKRTFNAESTMAELCDKNENTEKSDGCSENG